MHKVTFGLIALYLVILGLAVTGWVMNLVKLTKLDFEKPYKAEIIRGISVTPIGAITGWLKIDDTQTETTPQA